MGFFSGLSSLSSVVKNVKGLFKSESSDNSRNNLTDYLGAGLLGGITLGQSYVSDYFNRKAASKQYGYTKTLMDYENDYNSPLNMRARLEEAGYNPNLALNGVNVQSATGSTPQVKPAQFDLLGLLSAYNLEQQNDLLKAQRKLTDENTARAMTENLLAGRKANLLYYQDRYAEQEFETFKKTGKIPESYYKNMTGAGMVLRLFDQLSHYF